MAFEQFEPDPDLGHLLTPEQRERRDGRYHPVDPSLSVFRDKVMPPPPDGQPTPRPTVAPYSEISRVLSDLAARSQKTTLAGYSATDAFGRVFAASGQAGYSLAHVDEVAVALQGEVATRLRYRTDQFGRHPLNSLSRDTTYRVFVAHPVIVGDRVVGAVYLSRTPIDLQKFLYQERQTLTVVALIMLAGSTLVGVVFWRLISRPLNLLAAQSQDVASGLKPVPEALSHYGVRELADLGQSVLSMAETLSERSETIETYTTHVTHELKSPATAIIGAAELLKTTGSGLTDARRAKLYDNIHKEGLRMNALLGRLRELVRARHHQTSASATLSEIVERVRSEEPGVKLEVENSGDLALPLSHDQGAIILSHMAQNAAQHGAKTVWLQYDKASRTLTVRDDGNGISPRNAARLTEPFFTTRRDAGGTGMGLAIVVAILERQGGRLSVEESTGGAHFRITFSAPDPK